MRVVALSLSTVACALVLAACGGSSRDGIVSISIQEGAASGPPSLVATVSPSTYRGRGWVMPLSAVRRDLPSTLPRNVRQPVGRGINRFVVVRLASGRSVTYGPLAWPSSITRVVAAMNTASRSGVGAASPAEARADVRDALTSWLAELRRRARQSPSAAYRNLHRRVFFDRLHRLERRFDFKVVRARILGPAQDAPLVVVQTSRPSALARDVPAIEHLLDPKRRTADDRTGWAYEGFFLEAIDGDGTPFLAVYNFFRGPDAGGGQWAARESLFPYDHG
jgi:hypothetical protein